MEVKQRFSRLQWCLKLGFRCLSAIVDLGLSVSKLMVLSFAELFFPRVNPWMVALGVILALLAVVIPLSSYCIWRQHRAKGKVTRRENSM